MVRLTPFAILLGFLALTLPLMPVQYVLTKLNRRAARWLPWVYHRLLCRLLGMTVIIKGALPKTPSLIVANHVSWLDIPLLSSLAPLSFISKREVGTWPLFGAMAKLQRTIFIDRERRHKTGASSTAIGERLLTGDMLVLFPEGTSSDGTQVLPFKSSYFGVVESINVPVVPITISYLGTPKFYAWHGDMDLLPHLWTVIKSGPIKVQVTIHPELVKADRKTMTRDAERVIRSALGETSEIR
jgi:lyso-ornithine lipid O-acyltransferase